MGNCITIPEGDVRTCALCNTSLSRRYAFCVHCKDRFHYICLQKYNPHLNTCVTCKNHRIQFFDSVNDNIGSSNKSFRNSI